MNTNKPEWELEFDKSFKDMTTDYQTYALCRFNLENRGDDVTSKLIKDFFRSQLTTIKERVENSEFPKHYGESGIAYQNGYDDGLLEALSIISEYLPEEKQK